MMYLVMVNDNDGILKELVHVGVDREVAEKQFLDTCETSLSNWDDYDSDDRDAVLGEGFVEFGGGVVMFIDTSNCATDDEIRDALTKQPAGDVTVAEIVHDGEIALKEGMSVDEILELCGRNLDSACSWDILGQILFKGSDGKWYTITTDASIGEAHPGFVEDTLAENKNE